MRILPVCVILNLTCGHTKRFVGWTERHFLLFLQQSILNTLHTQALHDLAPVTVLLCLNLHLTRVRKRIHHSHDLPLH